MEAVLVDAAALNVSCMIRSQGCMTSQSAGGPAHLGMHDSEAARLRHAGVLVGCVAAKE